MDYRKFVIPSLNKKIAKPWWIILLAVFLLSAAIVVPARAQTATPPTPRDALMQAITQQAQSDEKAGTKETVNELNLLFGQQAGQAGMTLLEVKQVYEDAYSAAAAAKPWWDGWLPNLGWIAAVVALLIAAFRGVIEEAGKKFFNSLGEALYNRFAGTKPFWMLALRRYKAALYEKHHELKLPFRPGRPLEMQEVYVPVKVKDQAALTDAYQAIERHKKLVVLGAPGAGKSILLRHVALTYAERDPDEPLVPVLVELNRLNDAGSSMFDQIVAILKQNDFPNGENFLKAWLKTGQLLLMFDGLDEVNTDRREQVTAGIRDLLAEYPGCHAIVTCRTQVYKGEFADWADQTLEVAEFSDQQIQRFLFAWQKDLPPGKSVEHLWANLSERPRILALARNPLMLTIIAFLYADTEFVLPHSRAEFYDTAVTVLLEQWKEKRNRYKAASKRLVMQHLALFMQDTAAERGQERRTIDLPVLLAEIKKVLPALNLKDDEVQPLLDEIVERSGLMFALEGGLKYQFTHLTLQEFFAAHALIKDDDGLLRRFKADPDAWREVVKLWCGLEQDSTHLLTEIYAFDIPTAFECLVDSQKVDILLANKIIEEIKAGIFSNELEVSDIDERMFTSFSVIASDPHPRGIEIFTWLFKIFDERVSGLRRSSFRNPATMTLRKKKAAYILSKTNLFKAAEVIFAAYIQHSQQYSDDPPKHLPEFTQALVKLGDIALPTLSLVGKKYLRIGIPRNNSEYWLEDEWYGSLEFGYLNPNYFKNDLRTPRGLDTEMKKHVGWGLNTIREIGTPKAARSLVEFLWHDNSDVCVLAALHLTTLIQDATIIDSLWNMELPQTWHDTVFPGRKSEKHLSFIVILNKISSLLLIQVPNSKLIKKIDGKFFSDIDMASINLEVVEPDGSKTNIFSHHKMQSLYLDNSAQNKQMIEALLKVLSLQKKAADQNRLVQIICKLLYLVSQDKDHSNTDPLLQKQTIYLSWLSK